MPAHAERGRVDDKTSIGNKSLRLIPAMGVNARAEMRRQFFRPAQRAVHHRNMTDAARQKRMNHRPACPAGTQNQSAISLVPAGSGSIQIGGKTIGIGVAAAKPAIFKPECVDRADGAGCFIKAFSSGIGRLLVGNGDISASKAICGKRSCKEEKSSGLTSTAS